MARNPYLVLPVLALASMALMACSAADWENATTYLPLERGPKPTQETAQADASPPAPPAQAVSAEVPAAAQPVPPAPSVEGAQNQQLPIQSPVSPPDQTPVVVADTAPSVVNEHCRAVATQRASDGQYMGMDEDAQHQEYERTYADCAAWDAAHR